MRFGRIIDQYVIDVYDADSVAELEKRLGVTGFTEVPFYALSGDTATKNDDGSYSFTHPPKPQPQPEPEPEAVAVIEPTPMSPDVAKQLDSIVSDLALIKAKLGI